MCFFFLSVHEPVYTLKLKIIVHALDDNLNTESDLFTLSSMSNAL